VESLLKKYNIKYYTHQILYFFIHNWIKLIYQLLKIKYSLKVLAQLVNAEIARPDVMIWVQTRDLTIVCEFNFSELPLLLRQKKIKYKIRCDLINRVTCGT
jgi:hypothetical protein